MLESYVTKTRDKAAALKFIKKALKRHGSLPCHLARQIGLSSPASRQSAEKICRLTASTAN